VVLKFVSIHPFQEEPLRNGGRLRPRPQVQAMQCVLDQMATFRVARECSQKEAFEVNVLDEG
jgi:hypothetical protein